MSREAANCAQPVIDHDFTQPEVRRADNACMPGPEAAKRDHELDAPQRQPEGKPRAGAPNALSPKHPDARKPLNAAGDAHTLAKRRTARDAAGKALPAPHSLKAAGLETTSTSLDFHAVAGRPPLAEPIKIRNDGSQPVMLDVRIDSQGADAGQFVLQSGVRVLAPPDRANHPPVTVEVQYVASKPGSHHATLVVTTEQGELRVPLSGTALDIGSHARTEAADGAPEPVHELPDHPAEIRSPAEARSQLLDAADSISALAMRYQGLVAGADEAAKTFGAQIVAAGSRLGTLVIDWVKEEGMDQNEKIRVKSQESGAGEFVKFLALKGIAKGLAWVGEKGVELLAEENPIGELIVDAIDIGWSLLSTKRADAEVDERAEGYREHMNDVGDFAIKANDTATRALMVLYGGLMSRYATAFEGLRIRSEGSGQIGKIQNALCDPNAASYGDAASRVQDAQAQVTDFEHAERDWADALRELADAGSNVNGLVDAGYAALIDHYIEFKADGDRTVRSLGTIDPNARANIELAGFTFGKFREPSPTVEGQIRQKTLADLATWDVEIELHGVSEGSLTLHQGPEGASQREAKLEGDLDLRGLGGIEGVWKLLDGATLGTHTLWGAK